MIRIIDSKNPEYSVGEYITGMFGWRTHTIGNPSSHARKIDSSLSAPNSTAIGVLGMPG